MNARRVRQAALTALTAGVVAAAPATPAHAADVPIVGGASFARTVPFIDGTIYAFECHAAAPGAVSTAVDSCRMGQYTAPPSTSAGPFATTRYLVAIPITTYQVCWTVTARYDDGTSQSKSGCTTSSPVAGAGAG